MDPESVKNLTLYEARLYAASEGDVTGVESLSREELREVREQREQQQVGAAKGSAGQAAGAAGQAAGSAGQKKKKTWPDIVARQKEAWEQFHGESMPAELEAKLRRDAAEAKQKQRGKR